MQSARRTLAGAGLACALTLAGAVLPVSAALAALEEGAPVPAARAIPVAPVDPDSTVGRIVLGFAEGLEQHFGSGSNAVRLALDAPMWAEERDNAVIVHLPGAHLVDSADPSPQWTFGDLSVAITPRNDTTYDFEAALPPVIERPNQRLEIREGTVSGTWRSDLELTTKFEADAADLQLFKLEGVSAVLEASLASLAATETLAQEVDGLWKGRSALSLSDFKSEGLLMGKLDVTSSVDGIDGDLIKAMHGSLGWLMVLKGSPEALPQRLAPLLGAPWGRSDMVVAVDDLTVTGDDWGLAGNDKFVLGRLFWRTDFDDRGAHADVATKMALVELMVSGATAGDIPPGLIPHAITVDVALERLPFRQIVEALSRQTEPGNSSQPDLVIPSDVLLGQMDAADTSFELRELYIAAPSFELIADGAINVESASLFGVIGRIEARIRGVDRLMELAVKEGEEDMVALLIVLQGLGRPVFSQGADEPFYAYEIDLRRDGAVTVNGIPFDMLLQGGLTPQ